jgi:CRP/FNR family cyclic AMP-dependent transcriptional regulator
VEAMDAGSATCVNVDLQRVASGPGPWAPGQREDDIDIERAAANPERTWCMSEVDIFADLDEQEMDAMAAAAPMKTYAAGALIYTPHQPVEALFILKRGRIRIFRVSADGRALTTAIINPGTIFGEMVIVGQQMHDSFAEALDEVVVCVMTRADVQRLLLGDQRIAARISETLGRRLAEVEQRLSDAVFKSVPQRIAGALTTIATQPPALGRSRPPQVRLTHEQLAALVGTSRETTTKVLGEFADQGLIRLGRGRIAILDPQTLRSLA